MEKTTEEKREFLYNWCVVDGGKKCETCEVSETCGQFGHTFRDMTNKGIETVYNAVMELSGNGSVLYPASSQKPLYDPVNSPKHYASTSVECIDMMVETQGSEAVIHFCICNAFKYLWRHNSKNGAEDIKKASWYLNKAVELMDK